MKKHYLLHVFLLLCNVTIAQTADEKYLLTSKSNSFSVSNLNLLDPYLSPIVYSGNGLRSETIESKFLSNKSNSPSSIRKFGQGTGYALNPTGTSSMIYYSLDIENGIFHHFPSIYGIKLMAGGSWAFDFGYKTILRNINNPMNIDLATNFNLSGIIKYDFHVFKKLIGLQLSAQMPIMGCMFVPPAGATYYEMFYLLGLDNTLHFSSLHNKYGINADMSFTIPFKKIDFYFGLKHRGLKYAANERVFKS